MVLYSFIALHSIIHPRAITEFMYRYSAPTGFPVSAPNGTSLSRAHIFLSFRLQATTPAARQSEIKKLLGEMEAEGMRGTDISDDELAKGHLRYMIGGSSAVKDERLFRFGEPSDAGSVSNALTILLQSSLKDLEHCVNSCWGCGPTGTYPCLTIAIMELVRTIRSNCSYQANIRQDLARILAGIQVPPNEYAEFEEFLTKLGYSYIEETQNPIYRSFLRSGGSSGDSTPTKEV
jgi:threonine dehydratase